MDIYKKLFEQSKNIAIIGAKDSPASPVNGVGRYLIDHGYTVFPVHPVRKSVWGIQAFQHLADIPSSINIVDVFRASEYCVAHAKECLALADLPKVFWMQKGIKSAEAKLLLTQSGVLVVEDTCLMVEHMNQFL